MSENSTTERDTIEALADSFVARFRTGERPSIEEYAKRYPELAEELRELLPALVLLEQNASPEDTSALGGNRKQPGPPPEIGDFTIVREIGRGGMGVVYEAVQQSLGRHVALKVLSSPGLLNPTHLERFHLEARAAARLHHTHIVPVFGVGEHNGLHYYAMQFIQGQSLDLVIDELRRLRKMLSAGEATNPAGDVLTHAVAEGLLTGQFRIGSDGAVAAVTGAGDPAHGRAEEPAPENTVPGLSPLSSSSALSHSELSSSHGGREFYRSVARVGLQVAEALAYAHTQGILHRDIKPSNLLLDAKGNVWITDFGLARDESSDGLTRTGDFVGTLRYMAPERLEGWSDRRSDLYSLGATLYELLTLKMFLDTPGRGQLVDKILHENPPAPSKADPAIPRDLETIVLKAIGKEPTSRYRSAEAMAEDLERFLADRTILARRSTPVEQLVRWCRRNPVVAGLSGAVAALLVAAVAILAFSNARIRHEVSAKDAALRQTTVEAAKATAISKLLQEALESANPDAAKGADYTVRQLLDEIASNLHDELKHLPEAEAAIRTTIGNAYRRLGMLDKAGPQLETALDLKRRVYGPEHPEVADSMVDYIWYLLEVDEGPAAEALAREAVATYRRAGLPDDQAVRVLEALAFNLWGFAENRDELPQIAEIADEIREIVRRNPEKKYPQIANVLHWISDIEPDSQKAEQLARESVALHRELHGESHPETAYGLQALASVLAARRQFDEAESCIREASAIFRQHYKDSQKPIVQNMLMLAEVMQAKGNQEGFEDLRAIVSELASPSDMDWETWRYRAALHAIFGEWEQVEECWQRAAELAPRKKGFSRFLTALARLARDDRAGYRKMCAEALEIAEGDSRPQNRYWAVWTSVLAPGSISPFSPVVDLANSLAKEAPENVSYRMALGAALYRDGRFEEARIALTTVEGMSAGDNGRRGNQLYAMLFLAMTEAQLQRADEARAWLRRTVTLIDRQTLVADLSAPWYNALLLDLWRKEADALVGSVDASAAGPDSLSGSDE